MNEEERERWRRVIQADCVVVAESVRRSGLQLGALLRARDIVDYAWRYGQGAIHRAEMGAREKANAMLRTALGPGVRQTSVDMGAATACYWLMQIVNMHPVCDLNSILHLQGALMECASPVLALTGFPPDEAREFILSAYWGSKS